MVRKGPPAALAEGRPPLGRERESERLREEAGSVCVQPRVNDYFIFRFDRVGIASPSRFLLAFTHRGVHRQDDACSCSPK